MVFPFEVALLAEAKLKISFRLKYVIALALRIMELKMLFQLDNRLWRYFILKWLEANHFGNNFLFISYIFSKSICLIIYA